MTLRPTASPSHPGWITRGVGKLAILFFVLALVSPPASPVAHASPREASPSNNPETHWSLRPLQWPGTPEIKNTSWPRSPIDPFILAKLEASNLAPSAPAAKRDLIRRVYFDLLGLPPSPEETEAFLANEAPDAYEQLVDRLLASPRYGERWARHWLDLVHFAETHGHDQDRIRTNAWPYRDYVIASLNADKPYARFVEEQIAGDTLYPENPAGPVAMGLLASGPWDESSLRDIREDTVDRQIARYLDRDDVVTTVMQTFVSTTVHCARCHDHKFDPVSQAEYYGLQAVFAGTDKANRAYDPDPSVHATRRTLIEKKAAIERRDPALLASLSEPAFVRGFETWESSAARRAVVWTVLEPTRVESKQGAKLTSQSDGSVLASGARPDTDTYVLSGTTKLRGLTAVRLEVLADESLPKRGPGRQDNGNLHLTRIEVRAAPLGQPNRARSIPLQKPWADFNQAGWEIAKAVDEDAKSAWGIYPEVGKPHQAIFELSEAVASDAEAELTVILDQLHGGGHLIGRPRISVTTAQKPVSVEPWPEAIAAILATPRPQRSQEQTVELALYYLKSETTRKLEALPKPQWVYAGASDFVPDGSFKPAGQPRPVHLLQRGDIHQPGALAEPGALACVATLSAKFTLGNEQTEGKRRAALARWITDTSNPLTWRSIVNRIWQYHFGRGLVDTPNDFGRMGSQPTHPELLDWLALTFRDQGGSFKKLHRLILTSSVYRQAAAASPTPGPQILTSSSDVDPDNRLLWRMNRTRLDAEQVRDALLSVSGQLDLTMGGPSVQQFVLSPGIHVTPKVDYEAFDVDSPDGRRRAIYRFIFRTLPDPMMDTLDCADASQLTPARNESITALQALTMLNHALIVRQSARLAERVTQPGHKIEEAIQSVYRLALGREASPSDLAEVVPYVQRHGLVNLCRVIFNSNEFMFVN